MAMESFTLTEISITVVAVIGALASCCGIIQKSRCKAITLCWGIFSINREVPKTKEELELDLDLEEGQP
tara:strand:+ start:181 stop:387 length:207 start_codon:yes stop_codon:yes gene_type:complete